MKSLLQQLGDHLVEDSKINEEFSAQRGLIDELFPYIYEASKRMSCRAISRWLETNGTKLSAATIAKALREPAPYWQAIADEVEPAARIFASAHNLDFMDVLTNHDLFFLQSGESPHVEGITNEGAMNSLNEYEKAKAQLREEWFSLSDFAREACLTYAHFGDKEGEKS